MNTIRRWGTLDPFFESGDLLGRIVANEGFLSAFLQRDPYDEYYFILQNEQVIANTAAILKSLFPAIHARGGFHFSLHHQLHHLLSSTTFSCFHLSDCLTHMIPLTLLRNCYAPTLFPITGVTHSLSYKRYLPIFMEHLWAGVSPQDAIIATSQSAQHMLTSTFNNLAQQYSLPPHFKAPQIATIPLGIASAPTHTPQEIATTAQQLTNTLQLKDSLIFLCLARISAHSKMDILPALDALKEAESLGLAPHSYTLIVAGWTDNDSTLAQALTQYAHALGIRLVVVSRPTDLEKNALYHLADIFISPSDNIQETFGLTLLEAGQAELPVIASHFDGYKDIIEEGVTGFLIPTLGPASSHEINTLASLWFDNQYHLALAQQTAIDIPLFAHKIALLATNSTLRTNIGKAASQRVASLFSWESVIDRYVHLWETLAATPLSAKEITRIREAHHPMQPDFAQSFTWHFTRTLTLQEQNTTQVVITPKGEAVYRRALPPHLYAGMESLIDQNTLHTLLLLARKPIFLAALMERGVHLMEQNNSIIHAQNTANHICCLQERVQLLLLWALKHHYIKIIPSECNTKSLQ